MLIRIFFFHKIISLQVVSQHRLFASIKKKIPKTLILKVVAIKKNFSFFFLLLVRDIEFLKSETTVKRKMLLQRIDFMMRRNDYCRHLAGLCTCS